MKKEYRIQMIFNDGTTAYGKSPGVGIPVTKIFDTRMDAQMRMDDLKKIWEREMAKHPRDKFPVEWKILSREVSEWKEV